MWKSITGMFQGENADIKMANVILTLFLFNFLGSMFSSLWTW